MTVKIKSPHAELVDTAIRQCARQRNVAGRVKSLQDNEHITPYFKQALLLSYNPYIRFGIKIGTSEERALWHKVTPSGALDIDALEIWELLEDFRHSTASAMSKMRDLERLFAKMSGQTAQIVLGILQKNLITGVGVSIINKAYPNFIPTFSVQLANKYTDRKVKSWPVFVEPKYDGIRATALVHSTGEVEVVTRTGRPIMAAEYFHAELRQIASVYRIQRIAAGHAYNGVIFDGELLGASFNNTVSIFRKETIATEGMYNVFDLVPMEAVTDSAFVSDGYEVRRGMLRDAMQPVALERTAMSPAYKVGSKSEVWDIYNRSRELGYEGIIVKSGDGLWQRKRSNDWLKVKAEETIDLRIIGAFEGEGEMEGTLGGLIVDFEGVEVRVGSGFLRNERDEIWELFLSDLVKSTQGETDFELIGGIVEVQYQEITPAKSLRHPVFVRLRPDKDEVSF